MRALPRAAVAVVVATLSASAGAQTPQGAPTQEQTDASQPGPRRAQRPWVQWNVGVLTGLCTQGDTSDPLQSACWHNGLRVDALFGRTGNRTLGLGPFAEVGTASFDDLRLSAGLSALIPITDYYPLVLSAGGVSRRDEGEHYAGVMAEVFWGSRHFEYDSTYGMTSGFVFGVQRDLDESAALTTYLALRIDGIVPVLPFLALYYWLGGPGQDPPDDR